MWWNTDPNMYDIHGNIIGPRPKQINFLSWWDGGLTRQLLDGNQITKFGTGVIFTADGVTSNNGTKATPALSADILAIGAKNWLNVPRIIKTCVFIPQPYQPTIKFIP